MAEETRTITELESLVTGIDTSEDVVPIVDVSDTNGGLSGTTKKITLDAIADAIGNGELINLPALPSGATLQDDDSFVYIDTHDTTSGASGTAKLASMSLITRTMENLVYDTFTIEQSDTGRTVVFTKTDDGLTIDINDDI